MLRTARNRMPTPKSCSEHCKEQLCHLIVRKFVYWLASICPSNTLDQFVVANFTSFRLTKSILLEMAVYKLQFKLVRRKFANDSAAASVRLPYIFFPAKKCGKIQNPRRSARRFAEMPPCRCRCRCSSWQPYPTTSHHPP